MLTAFLISLFLSNACLGVGAKDQGETISPISSDSSHCQFDVSEKKYKVTDLLGCINDLASSVPGEGSDRSAGGNYRLAQPPHGQVPRQFTFAETLASLFGGNQIYQFPWSANSPDSVPSYYQSNYPTTQGGSVESSGGIGIDLFNALSSISRHDDLKCVSRILCEMASGSTPGSVYKRSLNTVDNFRTYSFLGLLNNVNLPGSSPLLNFAKATILGYANKGESHSCYQAYPKCPRNPDELVYYLNNHNGGFFRFFNRVHRQESYRPLPAQSYYTRQRYSANRREQAPFLKLSGDESDRTGTGELKFDASVFTARQDYRTIFFPEETVQNGNSRVVFPDDANFNDHTSLNRVPKSLQNLQESEPNELSQQNLFSHPWEQYGQDSNSDSLQSFERPPRNILKFPSNDEILSTLNAESDFYSDDLSEAYDVPVNSSDDERTESNTDSTKFFPPL